VTDLTQAQSNGFAGALSRKKHREVDLMPQRAWSDKRERQYEHIKEGLLERGTGVDRAEEIAARTVNKERAQQGEAREASRSSVHDLSPGRRGGLRSHRGSGGRTYDQLRNEAKERGIKGRSRMNKEQLEKVLSR
jgi:plasmid stabilization system protein ParE